ncbi:beta-ketoacyl synthase chain length factor [Shewanella livingstonensis]|uniref:3-oxoacyl-ACP synthase n=1 Tax=Shewanella livingstonensis TaxID=150120 RepID=A0A3G8LZB3_9GAMM|nr:beta-ketoacyl synthase chain length factor [Shewanella livingstonensis]AZG74961.1 3-oxoacyl-ACP synthase [Shewanella livingstonensis]
MHLVFDLLSWGAWSPNFQTTESWQQWQQPNGNLPPKPDSPALAHIPAMQRRRFSRLTKMMLTAAHQCQPDNNCRSIFSSRHGELTRTLGLLNDITLQQALSPMAFSQSVHNTASGIFGIVNNNTTASTSIAAGEQTLTQALIEAYAQLAQSPQPVLVIFGDDPVPPVYSEFTHEVELPLALGLYLAPLNHLNHKAHKQTTLSVSDIPLALDNPQSQKNISLSELIHHITSEKNIQGKLCHWYWSLEHHD